MSENVPDPVELNLEQLLAQAYQPESIGSDLTERVLARLERAAAERRRRSVTPEPTPWRRVAWLYFANAVAVLLLIALPVLFWQYFIEPARQAEEEKRKKDQEKLTPSNRVAPRPRTKSPRLRSHILGQTLSTSAAPKAPVPPGGVLAQK